MIRRTSQKRAKRLRQAKPVRDLYRQENPVCQWLGCDKRAEVLHEIARGAARGKALDQPAALLHICHKHHTYSHNHPSVLRDVALKKLASDGTYDLKTVNRLRNRSLTAITEDEVDAYIAHFVNEITES